MKRLLIIGTGGFAREVYWHAQNSIGYGTEFEIKGFLEGTLPLEPEKYFLLPAKVYENVTSYEVQKDDVFVIALANSQVKNEIANIITEKGGHFINLIHKTALVAPNAILGEDLILCPYTIVTCDTTIGSHVMFNLYSSIGHDSIVGDYTSIMCYVDIAGNVKIGTHNFWGNCSLAIPGSQIGDDVIVGAGAVILKKIEDNQTVVGIPAREVHKNKVV
ncbi:NeuD/PglB/VioB family sugar acetyltransferase [Megasphaera sueciensis]|uniref:NeuD/PglB/VioB family sugar acetyltransferase n=1 Tax=Megasphaera sueciensis TaxID=349094 RepID=UPI003D0400AB